MLEVEPLIGVLVFKRIALREFLLAVREALSWVPPTWRRKYTGRPPFDPTSRIMALLVKERYGLTYRDAEIYLNENKEPVWNAERARFATITPYGEP
jgi:hypothetical protein